MTRRPEKREAPQSPRVEGQADMLLPGIGLVSKSYAEQAVDLGVELHIHIRVAIDFAGAPMVEKILADELAKIRSKKKAQHGRPIGAHRNDLLIIILCGIFMEENPEISSPEMARIIWRKTSDSFRKSVQSPEALAKRILRIRQRGTASRSECGEHIMDKAIADSLENAGFHDHARVLRAALAGETAKLTGAQREVLKHLSELMTEALGSKRESTSGTE